MPLIIVTTAYRGYYDNFYVYYYFLYFFLLSTFIDITSTMPIRYLSLTYTHTTSHHTTPHPNPLPLFFTYTHTPSHPTTQHYTYSWIKCWIWKFTPCPGSFRPTWCILHSVPPRSRVHPEEERTIRSHR